MAIDDKIRYEKLQHDIKREGAKISALSSGKIEKYEYLKGEEVLSSNQKQIIEQAKFAYSPLGKPFEKEIKTIEDQGEKQIKALEDLGKQLVETNELTENDFNIDKDDVPLEKKKKMFNELVEKKSFKFQNLKEKINPNNLIYKFKTEGISPKDFSNYQNLIDLCINLRDGNINLREVSKN